MMALLSVLAAAAPTGLRGSAGSVPVESLDGRAQMLDGAVTNTLPATMPVWVLLLIIGIIVVVAVIVVCLISNPPQSRSQRKLYQRMEQDRTYLQSNYLNSASSIVRETMKHNRR